MPNRPGSEEPVASSDQPSEDRRGSATQTFTPTLRGAVYGQVTEVSESALQYGQGSEPIATLRLERHDAHAGRTAVATVRLKGADALGFAGEGDLVEAVGRRTSALLTASHCINHSTGAVYKGGTVRMLRRVVILLAIFLALGGAMLFGITKLATEAEEAGREDFERQSQQMREESYRDCLASGAPASMCETLR